MGRVSLILPLAEAALPSPGAVERYRRVLEEAGHTVEVIAAGPVSARQAGATSAPSEADHWLETTHPGLASAAQAGLARASGDAILILDPSEGYEADDLNRVLAPILDDQADLVIGRRQYQTAGSPDALARRPKRWAAEVSRRVVGTADPLSGLVALRPSIVNELNGTFVPVGSRFAIDLLLRSRGRRLRCRFERPLPA
ncbi:MAG: glycosyltransferase [Isosphaeraceae bacterium]